MQQVAGMEYKGVNYYETSCTVNMVDFGQDIVVITHPTDMAHHQYYIDKAADSLLPYLNASIQNISLL